MGGIRSGAGVIVGVIDIGTNTVLLLVARIEDGNAITPLVYEQRIPRLGRRVDATRNLDASSMARVIAVLREYAALVLPYEPAAMAVCGTSAVRDAANRDLFARDILAQTGYRLEVLSGEEEAYWTYRGAASGVPGTGRLTVVDIGGGSTEIITGARSSIDRRISLTLGSVRLTERFLRHDPPTPGELDAAGRFTEEELARASGFQFAGTTLVGVAGTATSLAMLARGIGDFDIAAVTNTPLTRAEVEGLYGRLRTMPSTEILRLSRVMEGRSDVITAGALIARSLMSRFEFSAMTVSERGVRYGIAIREAERLRGSGVSQ
ncbi:MAG TPA: Ppx/GppA phosphatase family protein [Bacteroidota bacterium]|nr:Ppx/GppA phosphatase family protein [Bacteroidota bacterium]